MSDSNNATHIQTLLQLGVLPPEEDADPGLIKKFDDAIRSIRRPVTDQEACELVRLFGEDGCFGLASALIHLIETAPGWPIEKCLTNESNEWIQELRERAIRGGKLKG